ncbi:MAG: NFACT family protein, partial [Candidatus Micrarchaeota archaeon]|nr:NFACT family protein [Candidatus Micrarchaeota archaeon]
MRPMANLEIKRICRELQALAGSRISKMYGIGSDDFRFVFNARDGTKEIFARLGVCIHLTRFVREAPQEPTQLAMLLRKHVENSRVVSVYQHSDDRVIVFELEREKKFKLVFEMFAKGNLVLAGEEGKVLACRRTEEWRDRKTRIGEMYSFPSSSPSAS